MHLVFLSDNMNFSGGRKLLFEYALYLRYRGHKVDVLVQEERGGLKDFISVTKVKSFTKKDIPLCDIIVATTPREVKQAHDSAMGMTVHFCQGFEITDLEQRVFGHVLPHRYKGKGILHKFKIAKKKISWRNKIKRIDSIYKLPTMLITVSKHLSKELKKRYSRKVYLCENGIHNECFYPSKDFFWPSFSADMPLKIINIGPYNVTFKGIDTTLEAIRMLKKKNLPVMLIRVAPKIQSHERSNPLIDKCYENILPENLGELLRNSHVFISNSTEGEGFGLPAMEAISTGLIPVLSSISSYKNFSKKKNFCFFVPEHNAEKTAQAVENILNMPRRQVEKMRSNSLAVAQNFSFQNSCERFEKLLLAALHNYKK